MTTRIMKMMLLFITVLMLIGGVSFATLSTTSNRIQYSCTGTTGPYTFNYPIFASSDLTVIQADSAGVETTLTLTTHYSVTLDGSAPSAGSITLVTACPSGETLTLMREMDLTQETEYISGGIFPASSHENALDRLTMMAQQNSETLDRSVKMAKTATAVTDMEIDAEDARASKVIGFNSAGTGVTLYATSASVGNVNASNVDIDSVAGKNVDDIFDGGGDVDIIVNTVTTDTIDEYTADVGVTVDGVLCKDGGVEAVTDQGGGANLKVKVIDIGDWNMDTTATVSVAHGVTQSKIRPPVSAMVRNDANTLKHTLMQGLAGMAGFEAHLAAINSTAVVLTREADGYYDGNPSFDATSYNRGQVTIFYTE